MDALLVRTVRIGVHADVLQVYSHYYSPRSSHDWMRSSSSLSSPRSYPWSKVHAMASSMGRKSGFHMRWCTSAVKAELILADFI